MTDPLEGKVRDVLIESQDCIPPGTQPFVGWSLVLAGRIVDAVRMAESLTGTSGEQTAEPGTEGPSNPEGLAEGWSYEYRAVEREEYPTIGSRVGVLYEWRGSQALARGDFPEPWGAQRFVERRLVGPVERVTETEAE